MKCDQIWPIQQNNNCYINISLNYSCKQIHRQVNQQHVNSDIDLSPSGQSELKSPLYSESRWTNRDLVPSSLKEQHRCA